MSVNETSVGDENSQNTGTENSPSDLKSEIQEIKAQNAQLQEALAAFLKSQSEPKATKVVKSKEEIQKQLESDPIGAIQDAIGPLISKELKEFETKSTMNSEKRYWDAKAQDSFPLLKTSKEFQKIVAQNVKELTTVDGMSLETPTLVYRAAQLAASVYGKNQEPSTSKSMSGEAPSRERVTNGSKQMDDKKFEMFSKLFNLSEKSKKEMRDKK